LHAMLCQEALLRGDSGGAALDQLRAKVVAGGGAEPADSARHRSDESAHSQQPADGAAGGLGHVAAAEHDLAGAADVTESYSMPQAPSGGHGSASMSLAPSERPASASMAQAPSLPAAGLEPQVSNAATSRFAAALDAETRRSPPAEQPPTALQTVAEMDVDGGDTSGQQDADHEQNDSSVLQFAGTVVAEVANAEASGQAMLKRSSSRQTAGVKKPWK